MDAQTGRATYTAISSNVRLRYRGNSRKTGPHDQHCNIATKDSGKLLCI